MESTDMKYSFSREENTSSEINQNKFIVSEPLSYIVKEKNYAIIQSTSRSENHKILGVKRSIEGDNVLLTCTENHVSSFGKTFNEAKEMIKEALQLYYEDESGNHPIIILIFE